MDVEIITKSIKIGQSLKHKFPCPNCGRQILISSDTARFVECHACGDGFGLLGKELKNGHTVLTLKVRKL